MGNGIARGHVLAHFVITVVWLLVDKSVKCIELGHKITIWSSGQKYDRMSGLLYSRVNKILELNCSFSGNNSVVLEWNGLSVGSSIRLGNNSLISYKIEKVSWSLNKSVLWCGTRNLDNGVTITLIVGDLPSPPRDLTSNIYDVKLFKVYLSWTHALYTGRLPAYYKVSYNPCHNSTCIPHADKYQFCRKSHVEGHDKYRCYMLRDQMMIKIQTLKLCEFFRVTVVTVNEIGVSDAVSMILNLGYGGETHFMPTPLPPLDLEVDAKESSITVRWKARDYNILYDSKYIILYHAKGDKFNRTKEISKQNMVNLLDDIRQYTKYYVYLKVEIKSGNQSQASTAIGPVMITTDQGEPNPGPKIINVTSRVYDNDSNYRDVVLYWEEPKMTSWRGKPSNITVSYRNSKTQIKKYTTLPVSRNIQVPNTATLTGLKSSDMYKVSIRLCNTKTCGGIGKEESVASVKFSEPRDQSIEEKLTSKVLIIVIVIAFAIITAGLFLVIKCRADRSTTPEQPLGDLIPEEQLCPSSNYYEYAKDKSLANDYTDVQSQQC